MSTRIGLGLGLSCRGRGQSGWSPAALFAASEAGAWYDPSDLATVWQDSAGTTPGAVDSPVGRIDDKSGNANHWMQASAAARPMLRQDGSGNYYLERDGVDDVLDSTAGFTLQAGWTLAAAASFAAGTDTATRGIITLKASTTDYFILGLRQSIAEARSALRGAAGSPAVALTTATGGTGTYPDAAPAVNVSRLQSLSHDIRRNGITLDSEATAWDSQAIGGAQLSFGSNQAFDVIPASLYAAVALQRVASPAELDLLEAWLAGKAGVTL
jgi:hypothetical protein